MEILRSQEQPSQTQSWPFSNARKAHPYVKILQTSIMHTWLLHLTHSHTASHGRQHQAAMANGSCCVLRIIDQFLSEELRLTRMQEKKKLEGVWWSSLCWYQIFRVLLYLAKKKNVETSRLFFCFLLPHLNPLLLFFSLLPIFSLSLCTSLHSLLSYIYFVPCFPLSRSHTEILLPARHISFLPDRDFQSPNRRSYSKIPSSVLKFDHFPGGEEQTTLLIDEIFRFRVADPLRQAYTIGRIPTQLDSERSSKYSLQIAWDSVDKGNSYLFS